ncbi:MAG: amidohydrolase family protein [Elusimicrobia bacterium]|nr:amidohydrolase family protein [Elusimicrobiota bacterium]
MMLYLRDATVVDSDTLAFRRGNLAVEEGDAGRARFVDRVPSHARVLDCSGRLVTRSFIIAHHHLYSSLALGMPPPGRSPRDFVDILRLVWWKLDKCLDREMIYASALAGAMEAARCGATFVIDHHSSPNWPSGSLELIARALEEVGLSHLLCLELSDRDGAAAREEGLVETRRYLRRRQGLVGLHASFTVSDSLLASAVELARSEDAGLHVHVAEAPSDQAACLREHGVRVLERLRRAGALESPRTLLAHGVHLDAGGRARLKRSPAWLVQNPESNQHNAVGELFVDGLERRVLLGTDGMHGDMLASARAAYLSAQARGGLSPLGAWRRLRRAHDYLSQNGFSGDGPNNLVVLDYRPPTPVRDANWAAHAVYGLGRAHVESVIARGRLVVEKGRLVRIDEEQARALARRQAERLWRRLRS